MPTDLVFPEGNERKLVDMARKLGFTRLLLCYPVGTPGLQNLASECKGFEGIDVALAVLIERQDEIPKAQRVTKEIVAPARQECFEDKRIAYILGLESGKREDFIHHRNSGLNQVLIQAAMRTGKTMLVDAGALLDGKLPQHVVLGRVQQNNMFFRKYQPDVLVVSCAREALDMRAPRDMQDLLRL